MRRKINAEFGMRNAELLKKKPVVIGQTDSNRLILYIIIFYSESFLGRFLKRESSFTSSRCILNGSESLSVRRTVR